MKAFLVFVIMMLHQTLGAAPLDDAGFIAFGDLRGHIEPCGCDPATDLGGMRRLAEILARERRADPTLGSFCSGNIVAPIKEGALKTAFLLEGVASTPADACLLNELEIARLPEIKVAKAKPPFVLSNVKGRMDLAEAAQPLIVAGKFVILGYVSPTLVKDGLEELSPALLARWKTSLAAAKDKARILLFAGNDAELAAAESSGLFDAVVSSSPAPFDTVIGTQEKDDEKLLERKGSRLGSLATPLAAQGVLRGGKARFVQGPSIAELLQPKAPAPAPTQPLLATAKLVTWLDRSYDDETRLKDLFDRYNQAARSAFAGAAAERTKDLASTPFAGAEACATCHKDAFDVWTASKHAHAMKTLLEKNKQEDPECVSCHVLGAREKGGFVSLAASPQFANVQCETCHGPRLDHTKNPTLKPQLAADPQGVCVSCHNAQHSPSFKKDEYWKKIAHGRSKLP